MVSIQVRLLFFAVLSIHSCFHSFIAMWISGSTASSAIPNFQAHISVFLNL